MAWTFTLYAYNNTKQAVRPGLKLGGENRPIRMGLYGLFSEGCPGNMQGKCPLPWLTPTQTTINWLYS